MARRAAGAGEIVESRQAPFNSYGLLFYNMWREVKGGLVTLVYAGVVKSDRSQGVVATAFFTKDFEYVQGSRTYVTPEKAGGVRIEDADGEVLLLVSDSGKKFLFDVPSQQFLSPDTRAPLPTVLWAGETYDTGTAPPPESSALSSAGSIDTIAIDLDVNANPANTATSIGSRESCAAVAVGQTFELDVTVDSVPAVVGEAGGATGFQFALNYDPTKVRVTAINYSLFLAALPGSSVSSFGDAVPDSDGRFGVAVVDFGSGPEAGAGVLARITMEAIAGGSTDLSLGEVQVADNAIEAYAVSNVLGGQVVVGGSC